MRQFPNANVIFIEASQGTKDKVEFIKGLKDELRNRSIPMKSLKEDVTVESLKQYYARTVRISLSPHPAVT